MTSDANTAGSGFIAKFFAAEPHERGNYPLYICAEDKYNSALSRATLMLNGPRDIKDCAIQRIY